MRRRFVNFGGNARQRRKYRRQLERAGLAPKMPPFLIGEEVKLNTDCYGRSYKGRKCTVINLNPLQVQLPKRKSPLEVVAEHLDKMAAAA